MTMEDQRSNLGDGDGTKDQFPIGMRVLAVDDDPICLKVLENLLRKCQYKVTTMNQAVKAFKMLRENKDKFDLVISDVNMPDMDGFKLLELVGLELDLPVIMLSAHDDTQLVMKGVTHGACDYLLKPVRIEELKNIWQHVVRKKKFDSEDQNKAPGAAKPHNVSGEVGQGNTSANNFDHNGQLGRKRKDQSKDEEEDDEENEQENEDSSTQKKPRVVWSVELHRKFVAAVNQLGLEKAVPKKILDLMNVEGLTRENVASHLQKYRLYLKRISSEATRQANMVAALGGRDSMRIGLDGFGDFRSLSGSGQLPNPALSSYTSNGTFGRLNSAVGLNLRGINSSGLTQPMQSHNMTDSISTLPRLQSASLPASQNTNLFQGLPVSNCTMAMKHLNPIDGSNGLAVATSSCVSMVGISPAINSAPSVSSNSLALQSHQHQTHNMGEFGNQSSLRSSSLESESFGIGICSSSNFLDYNQSNQSWQSSIHLPKYPSNLLPFYEPFSNEQIPPNIISSSGCQIGDTRIELSNTVSVPLNDAQGDVQCYEGLIGSVVQATPYISKQRWEDNKQDYNQDLDQSLNSTGSIVSACGVVAPLGQSLIQNNAFCNKKVDMSLMGQLNGASASFSLCTEVDKFCTETKKRSSDAYNLEQKKSREGFVHDNFESQDDIMTAMVKQERNKTALVKGGLVFDASSLGSCI